MAISLSRYVNISSSVGSGISVPTRLLIGRLFTGNNLLPPDTFIQFSNAADVGTYFGITSEEYYRALFYFAWVSKSQTSAPAIQFARWVNNAVAPQIYSIPNQTQSLTTWQAITAGSFGLTIGGVSNAFSGLDFSAVTSFADVVGIIQTAIRTATGSQWTAATVTYVNGSFNFVGGSAVAASISVQAGASGTDITGLNLLGWLPASTYANSIYSQTTYAANAVWASGQIVESITTVLTNSNSSSNNFGSFLFLNNLSLNLSQIQQAAAWNAASAQNNMFLYTVPVIAANVSAWAAGLASYAGVTLTVTQTAIVQIGTITSAANTVSGLMNARSTLQVGMPVSGTSIPAGTIIASIVNDNNITLSENATGSATESLTFNTVQFPEQAPMMIEAATNYQGTNTVQNYMFQDFDPYLTPIVTNDSTAQSYDALSVNYYGQTQTAGTQFNFYQRGLMQGPSSAPLDQNTYVNEIWLKDAMGAALMQLLLNLTQLPANTQGQALTLLTIQGVINQGLLNGSISVGKTLTPTQQAYITSTSNDSNAWYQVQNSGYWVNCIIQPIPASSPVQYEAAYTLIYSKDDVIRLVVGSDILI